VSHRLSAALAASRPCTAAPSSLDPSAQADPARPRRYSSVGRKRALTVRQIEIANRYRHWGLPFSFIARRLHVAPQTVAHALKHPDSFKTPPRR
jgi:DNA-binding NarL/FixJ family response regulator